METGPWFTVSFEILEHCNLMHQSFVTTAIPPPTYGEGWGMAGLECGAITLKVFPECRGNDRVLTLGSLAQGDFLLQRAGQRPKYPSPSP